MWVLPSPPGTTVLSPVALQEPQEPPLDACSSQSDAQLRLRLHLEGAKPPAKRGSHDMSEPLGLSSPLPPILCLLPCPRPPGALSACDFCMELWVIYEIQVTGTESCPPDARAGSPGVRTQGGGGSVAGRGPQPLRGAELETGRPEEEEQRTLGPLSLQL